MNTQEIIDLANKHVAKTHIYEASARRYLSGAIALAAMGCDEKARAKALHSLGYSVGTSHPDYQRAAKAGL